MWIIVEGPDLAGKTSLCDDLEKAARQRPETQQVIRRHRGPVRTTPLDEYVRPMFGYRPKRGTVTIDDRWHLGEAIYPQLLGRPTQLNAGMMQYIEMFIRSRGGIITYRNPPLETLTRRYDQRSDGLIKRGQLGHLRLEYAMAIDRSMLNTVDGDRYDADHIIEIASIAAGWASTLSGLHTYVGPTQPTILFMGDKRSRTDMVLAPAFMPFVNTSGAYLMSALMATRLGGDMRRFTYGIANACDVDDPTEVWETLGMPLVVALGVNAHLKLREHKIPHSRVPHPQFARRFYHRELAAYGNVLATAASSEGMDLSAWRP